MSGHLPRFRRRLTASLLALTTAVGMGGLTACDSSSTSKAEGISIVASTNVYGSIAKAIAGEHATVHSIIKDPSADPHSYEASPTDIATLQDADIAIVNGSGYDEFAVKALANQDQKIIINAYSFLKGDTKADGLPDPDNELIDNEADYVEEHADEHSPEDEHAGHHHHHIPGAPNEHVFYNVDVANDLASDLAKKLSELDPANQTTYQDNEKNFAQRIGEVKAVLEKIEKQRDHARFLQTEPLATHLVDMADMVDATPHGFAEAIEEGADVSALQVAEMRDAIMGRKVDVFLFNTQNANSTTQEMRKLAEKNDIPVVDLTETLPEKKDYTTWMLDNVEALATALGVK
ncbi:metal ABC transporter solute-binding protein, Zn/Mn family [Lawsonella clevelandensis]|uniref:metal ABC transporter solute-binding protein, Zn/Mn family n=1 Tax=Lawsonella clevelandensis TaxID=1528099 RepID=UPI0023F2C879|nr:zinc ABC transporter substrate-binding protein [Lawsonella clevelandensis]